MPVIEIVNAFINFHQGCDRESAVRTAMEAGVTSRLLALLVYYCRQQTLPKNLLKQLLTLMADLATYDNKFSQKVLIEENAIQTISFLWNKYFIKYVSIRHNLLTVLRSLITDERTFPLLWESGFISSLFKFFHSSTSYALVKRLYKLLLWSSKKPIFREYCIRSNVLEKVLAAFDPQVEPNKFMLQAYALKILNNISMTPSGIQMLMDKDCFGVLFRFANRNIQNKNFQALLPRVCCIMNVCSSQTQIFQQDSLDETTILKQDDSAMKEEKYGSSTESDDSDSHIDSETQEIYIPQVFDKKFKYSNRMNSDDFVDLNWYKKFWREVVEQDTPTELGYDKNDILEDFFDVRNECKDYKEVYKCVSEKIQEMSGCSEPGVPDLELTEDLCREPLSHPSPLDYREYIQYLKRKYDYPFWSKNVYNCECRGKKKISCNSRLQATNRNKSEESSFHMDSPDENHLVFDSHFESGNLQTAVQVGPHEYELVVRPDESGSKNWFYFRVRRMEGGVKYRLSLVNMERSRSLYQSGMRPLLFSVKESHLGQSWRRVPSKPLYLRNGHFFLDPPSGRKRTLYTLTFSIVFTHSNDECYLSFHYPYTYTRLMTRLVLWRPHWTSDDPKVCMRVDRLATSLAGSLPVLLVTLTAATAPHNPVQGREVVLLMARVHPGESNSSWVVEGALEFLLSGTQLAQRSLQRFLFKIVPILNVDGVIYGSQRSGSTKYDLNRQWMDPKADIHPEIYNVKMMMKYCLSVLGRVPYLCCDMHGHRSMHNVCLYGCLGSESWRPEDKASAKPRQQTVVKSLERIMAKKLDFFSTSLGRYQVTQERESTARVVFWREFNVSRSYTLETSFCGPDHGSLQGTHFSSTDLKRIGRELIIALTELEPDGLVSTSGS